MMLDVRCGDAKLSVMRYLLKTKMTHDFSIVEAAKEIYDTLDTYGYIFVDDVDTIIERHSKNHFVNEYMSDWSDPEVMTRWINNNRVMEVWKKHRVE